MGLYIDRYRHIRRYKGACWWYIGLAELYLLYGTKRAMVIHVWYVEEQKVMFLLGECLTMWTDANVEGKSGKEA